jgi:1-acyl-sn-glycerol-3-phosphate acyltransferase
MQSKTFFYTVWVRVWFLILAVLFAFPMLVLVFLVPQRYRYNRIFFAASALLYKAVLAVMALPLRIEGKQHLSQRPTIFVANHTSSLDIALLGSLCGTHAHVWLAMSWLTQFVAFRYFLPRVAVLVDMSSPQKGVRSLIRTMQLMKERAMHVMIFPEGRRYTDDAVHEFYAGFALLAKRTQFPVVPIRIYNAVKVYPPEQFWMYRKPVRLIVGEPMFCGELETEQEFKDRVYAWFLAQGEA